MISSFATSLHNNYYYNNNNIISPWTAGLTIFFNGWNTICDLLCLSQPVCSTPPPPADTPQLPSLHGLLSWPFTSVGEIPSVATCGWANLFVADTPQLPTLHGLMSWPFISMGETNIYDLCLSLPVSRRYHSVASIALSAALTFYVNGWTTIQNLPGLKPAVLVASMAGSVILTWNICGNDGWYTHTCTPPVLEPTFYFL
jgi:hypothetical protein